MSEPVILVGARTAIGKLEGSLSKLSAVELGGRAIAAALARARLAASEVDYVLMGQVIQAGQGQNPARQAAVGAGIPLDVPASTINKVCLSGLNTIYLADRMIRAGDAEVVVAGGMESMSGAPYLLPGARRGYRLGNDTVHDATMLDGLTCAFEHDAMGLATERYNNGSVTRAQQDEFAALSHQRAAVASKEGLFADEIVPVAVPQRKGDPVVVDLDEGIRPATSQGSLASLRPVFDPQGTVTAGNASQISDGAAAVIVTSREKAEQLGVPPLGELVGYGQVAGPDLSLLLQPSKAIRSALGRSGLGLGDVDLFEINEAFAAVVLASATDLSIPTDVLNVNGGAIALGHPIGMSGTRLVLTALLQLRRQGGGKAAVGVCGGGGQGDAAIVASA